MNFLRHIVDWVRSRAAGRHLESGRPSPRAGRRVHISCAFSSAAPRSTPSNYFWELGNLKGARIMSPIILTQQVVTQPKRKQPHGSGAASVTMRERRAAPDHNHLSPALAVMLAAVGPSADFSGSGSAPIDMTRACDEPLATGRRSRLCRSDQRPISGSAPQAAGGLPDPPMIRGRTGA